MIQWNKGEPPEDGKAYLATVLTIKGPFSGTRRIDILSIDKNTSEWVSITSGIFIGDGNIIIAWSENNIYDGEVMTTETKPKPCPFCGSNQDELFVERAIEYSRHIFRVRCAGCGSLGPAALDHDGAWDFWNRRAEVNDGEETRS